MMLLMRRWAGETKTGKLAQSSKIKANEFFYFFLIYISAIFEKSLTLRCIKGSMSI